MQQAYTVHTQYQAYTACTLLTVHPGLLPGLETDQCLAIEDAPSGVEAAVAAGMRVVVVPSLRNHKAYPKPLPNAPSGPLLYLLCVSVVCLYIMCSLCTMMLAHMHRCYALSASSDLLLLLLCSLCSMLLMHPFQHLQRRGPTEGGHSHGCECQIVMQWTLILHPDTRPKELKIEFIDDESDTDSNSKSVQHCGFCKQLTTLQTGT